MPRNDWITRPPTLDSVRVLIDYARTPAGLVATVHVEGRCSRKRGSLWTLSETLPDSGTGYNVSDFLCHVALVCGQDRPFNQMQADRAMVGEHWEQPELPF